MFINYRSLVPLLYGFIFGIFLAEVLKSYSFEKHYSCAPFIIDNSIDSSENWNVHREEIKYPIGNSDSSPRGDRPLYASEELGIRERLVVILNIHSVNNAIQVRDLLKRHIPEIYLFASDDKKQLLEKHAHLVTFYPYINDSTGFLNAVRRTRVHHRFDWFLFMDESSYVNGIALNKLISKMKWNEQVVLGAPGSQSSCIPSSAVLLSRSSMEDLMSNFRFICKQDDYNNHNFNLVDCIFVTSLKSCQFGNEIIPAFSYPWRSFAHYEQFIFNGSPYPIVLHDVNDVQEWKRLHQFHIKNEIAALDADIMELEDEVKTLFSTIADGLTWPVEIPRYSIPPNRWQLKTWDFFTNEEIFQNEVNQNSRLIEGNNKADIDEVVSKARSFVEDNAENGNLTFVRLRDGYRLFDPARGMDYIIDLEYAKNSEFGVSFFSKRIHIIRPIELTQLVQMPIPKQDAVIHLVIPIKSNEEILPMRFLLSRHIALCSMKQAPRTRIITVLGSNVNEDLATSVELDVDELRRRCGWKISDGIVFYAESGKMLEKEAFRLAIESFGLSNLYALLPPHADIEVEFLDRVRTNTIENIQVFFPLPFAEYNPIVSGMDISENEIVDQSEETYETALEKLKSFERPRRKRPLYVNIKQGRFDSNDFTALSIYGQDYLRIISDSIDGVDLINLFLNQRKLQIFRAVDPALRIRFHHHECDDKMNVDDLNRCIASSRENIGDKDQLARLLSRDL